MYSVRGFKERVISADKGVLGSFEIYTPEFARNQRFLLFLDGARLVNNSPNAGEMRDDSISSWGVGYRLFDSKMGLSMSLSYAKVIDDIDNTSRNTHRPWQLSLTQSF